MMLCSFRKSNDEHEEKQCRNTDPKVNLHPSDLLAIHVFLLLSVISFQLFGRSVLTPDP